MDEDWPCIRPRKWISKEEGKEIWPDIPKEPQLIDLLENDPYFAEYIPTPAWDRFKNALTKVYNLDKDNV